MAAQGDEYTQLINIQFVLCVLLLLLYYYVFPFTMTFYYIVFQNVLLLYFYNRNFVYMSLCTSPYFPSNIRYVEILSQMLYILGSKCRRNFFLEFCLKLFYITFSSHQSHVRTPFTTGMPKLNFNNKKFF